MGLYAPDAPPARNYAEETRSNLEAQIELAPDLFEAEANPDYGRSSYADLDLRILRDTLLGDEDQEGLLDLYENHIMPGLAASDAAGAAVTREADVAAVEQLGARATEAFRAANADQSALLDELNAQALAELQAGAELDPALAREVEQAVRSGQAARGMGYGLSDLGNEVFIKGQASEQLRRQRQAFGQSMVGINQATSADPFLAILGRPGVQVGQGMGVAGQGQGFNPGNAFNPESAYGGALAANNFNAQNNAAIAASNARAGVIGGSLSALGRIGGGWAQGGFAGIGGP